MVFIDIFCIRDVGIFVLLKFVNKLEIIISNINFDSICPHLMQQSGQELDPKLFFVSIIHEWDPCNCVGHIYNSWQRAFF